MRVSQQGSLTCWQTKPWAARSTPAPPMRPLLLPAGMWVKTLTAYLEHSGAAVATARALFLHRSTLRYRLARIRELTESSLSIVGAVSGLNDVDAITLSMGNLVRSGLSVEPAAAAVFAAVTVNTVVKAALALTLGGAATAEGSVRFWGSPLL